MIVYERIREHLQKDWTVNVAIAGMTCSGKTTLANSIKKYFGESYSVSIISQDDYYKDLKNIPRSICGYLTDSVEAFYTDEFISDAKRILQGEPIFAPKYDVTNNKRIINDGKIIRPARINIFEGLHAIALMKRAGKTYNIFLDIDEDVCLKRRIKRDTSSFDISEWRIHEYWEECVMPLSKKYIYPQRYDADITKYT